MGPFLEKLKKTLTWLRQNKGTVWVFVLSVFVFFIVFFPTKDLSDIVSAKISQMTQGQVSAQFKEMNLSFIPMGLSLQELSVQTGSLPPIKTDRLIVSPNIAALLSFNPGATVHAHGFMGGQLKASAQGHPQQEFQIEADHIALSKVSFLPVPLKGKTQINAQVTLDTEFTQQPDGSVKLLIKNFQLPTSNVETALGPLTLPELKLSSLSLTGRLKEGQLQIEKIQLGNRRDELYGSVKGYISLNFNKRGGRVVPIFGAYNLSVDLTVKKSLAKRAGLFMSFIDQYKRPLATGDKYALKITGTRFGVPPRIQRQ